jgi:hypothetical protein
MDQNILFSSPPAAGTMKSYSKLNHFRSSLAIYRGIKEAFLDPKRYDVRLHIPLSGRKTRIEDGNFFP